jgi:hypothetical protein
MKSRARGSAALIVACAFVFAFAACSSGGTGGAAAGGVLAPPGHPDGKPIDGIECGPETPLFHIHAHLAVFVNGVEKKVPAGVGIPGCLYWLHTHSEDGIIHIEAPVRRTFTLGDFFDIWQQPLGPDRVGPATGAVVVYVDGKKFDGSPRAVTFHDKQVIQLDVGSDVPPKPYTFAQ